MEQHIIDALLGYGPSGIIGALALKLYLDNQGLHEVIRKLQDKRLEDYKVVSETLSDNVDSNRAVTSALMESARANQSLRDAVVLGRRE